MSCAINFLISFFGVWAGVRPAHFIGASRSERKTCFCVRCKVCCYPGRQTGRCNPVTPTISGECRHVKVQDRVLAYSRAVQLRPFPTTQTLFGRRKAENRGTTRGTHTSERRPISFLPLKKDISYRRRDCMGCLLLFYG